MCKYACAYCHNCVCVVYACKRPLYAYVWKCIYIKTLGKSRNKHSYKMCPHAWVSSSSSLASSPLLPPPPPHFKACGPFSILVLKGFFVSQAICPSLFGVQTVVKYPVTDPECCEWQLLSGQLAVVPRNIPERII